jgi:hypothetical protein
LYRKTWGVSAGESASSSQAGLALLLIKYLIKKRSLPLESLIIRGLESFFKTEPGLSEP